MGRAIDAEEFLKKSIEERRFFVYKEDVLSDRFEVMTIYDDLINAVNEMPTIEPKQEWISVKDRLPNRGERVLCFMKSYGKNQNDTISDNVYNGILVGSNPPKYVWEWNGDYVTHWMPLPEPPEKE